MNVASEDFAALFATHGGTDEAYLRRHFPRFAAVRQLTRHCARPGDSVLDVGAHWLHQSLLYALDGCAVTAMDIPETFDKPEIQVLARAHAIRLIAETDLASASGLAKIPDDTFDVVLFTEIIEHITFNPVQMWREIYRVMKPGARLVVTTPNYYALRGRAWHWWRFLTGRGSGVDVAALMRQPTFAHHWKEYSLRELRQYFRELSADFVPVAALHVGKYEPSGRAWIVDRAARIVEAIVPPLRPNLYLELELTRKSAGIQIEPSW